MTGRHAPATKCMQNDRTVGEEWNGGDAGSVMLMLALPPLN
jgi:hypothetical protein